MSHPPKIFKILETGGISWIIYIKYIDVYGRACVLGNRRHLSYPDHWYHVSLTINNTPSWLKPGEEMEKFIISNLKEWLKFNEANPDSETVVSFINTIERRNEGKVGGPK